ARECDATWRTLALELRVMNDLADELDEIHLLEHDGGRIAIEPSVVEDLPDETIEAFGFALDAVELLERDRRILPRETDRHLHARERRAQLVRDVAQQALARCDERAQSLGHRVEFAAEQAELVTALGDLGAGARVEISL